MNKKSYGARIVPLYNLPETYEQKDFDCLDDINKRDVGEDRPVGVNYKDLWFEPIKRMKYTNIEEQIIKKALDYSDIHPFYEHEYGSGYDGRNQRNRSEFPRHHPFTPSDYQLRLEKGDFDNSKYSEPNKSLFPVEENKPKMPEYTKKNLQWEHMQDHNQDQSILKVRGSVENREVYKEALGMNDNQIIGKVLTKTLHKADYNSFKRDIDNLIKILTKISSPLEESDANDYIDYASGGALSAIDEYETSDTAGQKNLERLIKNGTIEADRFFIQLKKYEQDPKFQKDAENFIISLLKTQYKNLWSLAKMGE
jgi:hypothetical protein